MLDALPNVKTPADAAGGLAGSGGAPPTLPNDENDEVLDPEAAAPNGETTAVLLRLSAGFPAAAEPKANEELDPELAVCPPNLKISPPPELGLVDVVAGAEGAAAPKEKLLLVEDVESAFPN